MSMQLDDLTISHYPTTITIPRPFRSNDYLETYSSVVHFSWGISIIGKIIELYWNYLPSVLFDQLDEKYQEDKEMLWRLKPNDPLYKVQIIELNGEYHERIESETTIWRKDVNMKLLIIGESGG